MEQALLSAVIIDDEADGRNIVALLLQQFFAHIRLAGQATGVAEGIRLVQAARPDIIFLDVEMGDGNAFDLILACQDDLKQVILITAYEHYALKAIKASVLDYLLKPVNKEEFIQAVQKAVKKTALPQHALPASFTDMYRHLVVRKVGIPTLNGFVTMNVDDIVRCEAAGNYTTIIFTNHEPITACRTLGKYEDELKVYGFIRVHNKHLINPGHIIEYNKGKGGGGFVTLYGREVLEVSTRRKAELLQALG